MLSEGSRIFLQLPGESAARVLHPGLISDDEGGGYMAVMDEPTLNVKPGQEAFVFFERKREFVQQPVRIDAVMSQEDLDAPEAGQCADDDFDSGFASDTALQAEASVETVDETQPRLVIGFQTTGEVVSAESRQCYRTLTSISSNVTAVIDGSGACPVLDVSATGFSILCERELRQGQVVRVALQHEGKEYSGSVIVQSTKELDDGRVRYGMYCAGDEKTNGSLFKGLRQVGTIIQRAQLRRMKGAG